MYRNNNYHTCVKISQDPKRCICIELIGLTVASTLPLPIRLYAKESKAFWEFIEINSQFVCPLSSYRRLDGGPLCEGYYLFNKRRHVFVRCVLNQCMEALALCYSRYLSETYTPRCKYVYFEEKNIFKACIQVYFYLK